MTDPSSHDLRDPEMDALLQSERGDPAYADAKARLARRLAFSAIAEAASAPAPRGLLAGRAGRLLRAALLVGGGAVVGAVVQAHRDRTPAPAPIAAPAPIVARVPPPLATAIAPIAPVVPIAPPAPKASVPAPAPRAATHAAPRDGASTLGEEQRLVDTARSAVGRAAFSAALAALDEDEAQFPHGQLVEERELLRVQALSGIGRSAEAKARATRFEASFPHSIFLPAVREAMDTP